MKELTLDATIDNLDEVLSFVDQELELADCSPKTQMQIDVAVEELFANICNYAYAPGKGSMTLQVELREAPSRVEICFIDHGTPYNPLAKEDPDVTLSAEDRPIGGLGIYIVKKNMDKVCYDYQDRQNILTISKGI